MEENRYIKIRGAREHNLKNIDVDIPRRKMVVLTGLSGSGKSSLAFDTIYAEGQRRYVESLSSYARMFLGQLDKPDLDSIEGLSPAISIDQKSTVSNPRSTVGTVTEIYDYFRLLYARVGQPFCPNCGKKIKSMGIDQIIDKLKVYPEGTRAIVYAPVVRNKKGEYSKLFDGFRKSGYARVRVDNITYELDEEIELNKNNKHTIEVIVDRLVIKEANTTRLYDSCETRMERRPMNPAKNSSRSIWLALTAESPSVRSIQEVSHLTVLRVHVPTAPVSERSQQSILSSALPIPSFPSMKAL